MKIQILELRENGKTYNEIQKIVGCSKATISYHCKRHNLGGRADGKTTSDIDNIDLNNYYKNHTIIDTANYFKISVSSVKKLTDNKRKILTEPERRKANYIKVKSFRRRNKEKAIEYKGGKCVKCGYDKCINALDFHHVDPKEKDTGISRKISLNQSWKSIKKELDKCILVCSNCHREIHWRITTLPDMQEQGKRLKI